jgi:hypothetical protein
MALDMARDRSAYTVSRLEVGHQRQNNGARVSNVVMLTTLSRPARTSPEGGETICEIVSMDLCCPRRCGDPGGWGHPPDPLNNKGA